MPSTGFSDHFGNPKIPFHFNGYSRTASSYDYVDLWYWSYYIKYCWYNHPIFSDKLLNIFLWFVIIFSYFYLLPISHKASQIFPETARPCQAIKCFSWCMHGWNGLRRQKFFSSRLCWIYGLVKVNLSAKLLGNTGCEVIRTTIWLLWTIRNDVTDIFSKNVPLFILNLLLNPNDDADQWPKCWYLARP